MQKGCNNTSWLIVTVFSTLIACGCRESKQNHQSGTADSFAGKLVTFDVPKEWVLQSHVTKTNSESFQFLIPDTATDGTLDSANAGISIEQADEGLDVTNYADLRLQINSASTGDVVLTKIFANDKWCSAITHGQQSATPYIIMDRFGVDCGMRVFFRVAQPVLTNDHVVMDSISNFNAVAISLKIGGTNAVNSEMRRDHGTVWLRAFSDVDTNWMILPTSNLVYRSSLQQK